MTKVLTLLAVAAVAGCSSGTEHKTFVERRIAFDLPPGSRSVTADPSDFQDRLPRALEDGQLADFECFGRSYAFRFVVGGRALQAHVGLGHDATAARLSEALAAVNSLDVGG